MQRELVALGLSLALLTPAGLAAEAQDTRVRPAQVVPRGGSEYYPSGSDAVLLIPVHVWGEVREPGVHYVRPGQSLADTISVAGGPGIGASLPDVKLVRGEQIRYVDLFDRGAGLPVEPHDRIVVESSFKQSLPLLFTGISTVASIVTLYLVSRQQR